MNLQLAEGITALNKIAETQEKIAETQEEIAETQGETLSEIKGIRRDLVIDCGW